MVVSGDGENYRLLSESEWEYVARAGTRTPFHFGNRISAEVANYNGTLTQRYGRSSEFRKITTPVGFFPPNRFGLHDVHGNVYEWVEDCANANYFGSPQDGSAWWTSGDCNRRVLRGGSWNHGPNAVRSAYRNGARKESRSFNVGFRIARTVE